MAKYSQENILFLKYWKSEFENGNYVDIEDNYVYIYSYVYELTRKFKKKDSEDYIKKLEKLGSIFLTVPDLAHVIYSYLSDAYIVIKDFDNAWRCKRCSKWMRVDDIYHFKSLCTDKLIDGIDVYKSLASRKGLTSYGLEHSVEIMEEVTRNLVEFQKNCKINFVADRIDKSMLDKKLTSHLLFPGTANQFSIRVTYLDSNDIDPVYEEFKVLVRNAENTIRTQANMPKVGEGWISETELYYRVKEYFQTELVINHGRPTWLERQHFDVYFPERNIAIEYQGDQHLRPIDFFGGIEAFEASKKRDERKKELAEKNGCKLIYVYKDYNFLDIVRNIESSLVSLA